MAAVARVRVRLVAVLYAIFLVTVVVLYNRSAHHTPRDQEQTQHAGRNAGKSGAGAAGVADVFSAEEAARYEDNYSDLTDPRFLSYIRRRWLLGPAPVNVTASRDHSEVGQSQFVDRLLRGKEGGFFVECGAGDGQQFSTSLYFELRRAWTGLLVEPNPELFRTMVSRRRNAFITNSCLSPSNSTQRLRFKPMGTLGGIEGKMDESHVAFLKKLPHYSTSGLTVQCFPLAALLRALHQPEVTYLSLDVEGAELDVLRTIPFHELRVHVVSVDYRVTDLVQVHELETLQKLERIRDFFHSLGNYREAGILPWGTHDNRKMEEEFGLDVVFIRTDV